MKFRHLLVSCAAAAGSVALACSYAPTSSTRYDCASPGATGQGLVTVFDTAGIFSINGGPPNGPSGVNSCLPKPVLAIPTEHFDFAVDIEGVQAYVLPPRAVSSAGAAGWIGLTNVNYDTVSDAPTSGYNDSTALSIAPGSVFLVQALTVGCSALPYQSQRYVYSKYIIDSIHYFPYDPITAPSGLTVYYRMVTDPVCGFTSLAPGVPPH